MLTYLLLALTFLSGVVGIFAKTRPDPQLAPLRKLTLVGWIFLSLLCISSAANIIKAYRDAGRSRTDKLKLEEERDTAMRLALNRTVDKPFFALVLDLLQVPATQPIRPSEAVFGTSMPDSQADVAAFWDVSVRGRDWKAVGNFFHDKPDEPCFSFHTLRHDHDEPGLCNALFSLRQAPGQPTGTLRVFGKTSEPINAAHWAASFVPGHVASQVQFCFREGSSQSAFDSLQRHWSRVFGNGYLALKLDPDADLWLIVPLQRAQQPRREKDDLFLTWVVAANPTVKSIHLE